ncbi:MAG: aminomethyltransferase family protein [Phycisphaerales bacterium]|nr:aminomethyltransferase family protein [Phycisphaerales bacterium]
MPEIPNQSPMLDNHTKREAFFLPYGLPECPSQVVETFGDLDMEYAAIRKGCVIFDQPHVGTIVVTGLERGDFLNNMLTEKVDDLKAGMSKRAFWLNRKGRIDADIRVTQRERDMLFSLDRHLCKAIAETLASFVFAEDANLVDASDRLHRLSVHGPTAGKLIALAVDDADSDSEIESLLKYTNMQVTIAGVDVSVDREDLTGEIGLELCMDRDDASKVYERLIEVAENHPELKARETGWLAINAARIEAGHPMFNIDFTETNLPVESGIIEDRVSFTKGCYLGQEVVARMHARKACNKQIVALKVEGEQITTEQQEIHQPTGGSQIFEPGKEGETPVGNVTSSTISPMLGAVPICFAMVKASCMNPGTKLIVSAEGKLVPCTVQESLVFWSKPDAH